MDVARTCLEILLVAGLVVGSLEAGVLVAGAAGPAFGSLMSLTLSTLDAASTRGGRRGHRPGPRQESVVDVRP